ncbi:2-dehydropantoate 2-reductase [Halopseudomonas nanhaiensis]|uniref:2-dehydropantoate 2-reductase n=1 Tax=Halopseudomonas nanhaiensis TaxID=2830842 RepID=UPI001CBADD8A|nr:2-dehydropantoate 2-reductase [Halopseudomonas nanhaiensis]UAX00080.1 2-dehydropantoate 2-reductase [Halopseudomonas nanhaiensis]
MMFHVLGAGSLGLLWAARLTAAGLACRMILRDGEASAKWQRLGASVSLRDSAGEQVFTIPAEPAMSSGPIDRLVLATKAYSVTDALRSIAHRLHPSSDILLLQNGLGSQQAACDLLPAQRILFASVTDGAWLADSQTVIWAGKGLTRVGDPRGLPEPDWLASLRASGFTCQWEPDILPVLWEKLAVNCAINPFTALHDCANGLVPARAGPRLPSLLDELQQLLTANGMPDVARRLPRTVQDVIERTAANSSSMRQDVAAGRRTEIDYLLGFACRSACEAGLSLPHLEALYADLLSLLAFRGLPSR